MSRKRAALAPAKVTIIETQFVEADAASFKSVVQRLTGKESEVVVAAAAASISTSFANYASRITHEEEEVDRRWEGEWLKEVMEETAVEEFSGVLQPWSHILLS